MACFLAPAAAGMVAAAFRKKIPGRFHIEWFIMLVMGGSAGLFVEHVASGEIVPYPPFLSAMSNPADFAVMISEILSVGVPMLLACIATWSILVFAASRVKAGVDEPVKN